MGLRAARLVGGVVDSRLVSRRCRYWYAVDGTLGWEMWGIASTGIHEDLILG